MSRLDDVETIRQGLADLAAGDISSAEEVRASLVARGRLAG